jgi:hypothetical protein
MRIDGSSEIINLDSRIYNCHLEAPFLNAAHARLVQVSFPLHFASEFPDCGLRMCFYQQSQASFHNCFLGTSAAGPHSLVYQLCVDFDIRPHRTTSMSKNPKFMCIVSSPDVLVGGCLGNAETMAVRPGGTFLVSLIDLCRGKYAQFYCRPLPSNGRAQTIRRLGLRRRDKYWKLFWPVVALIVSWPKPNDKHDCQQVGAATILVILPTARSQRAVSFSCRCRLS